MTRIVKLITMVIMVNLVQACFNVSNEVKTSEINETQAQLLMSGAALLPSDLSERTTRCEVAEHPDRIEGYLSSEQTDYANYGWEKRAASDWKFFSAKPSEGKVLLIDVKNKDEQYVYQYLSNGTQNDLFEPWSSSKVMAITAAMATAKEAGLKDVTQVGTVPFSDLVTSIHSYSSFGQSNASSNSIATYFINLVGRERLTNYFSDGWLKLSNKSIRIRGGYGEAPYQPQPNLWFDKQNPEGVFVGGFQSSQQDPLAQSYRCDECGLTGNKPQTTLAMAEWLKRLAMQERDPLTSFPGLELTDVDKLFYGVGQSQPNQKVGGMMQGIGQGLAYAIAETVSNKYEPEPQKFLDDLTQGQWRIWQKIGWGPSETRGAAEYVLLAHVCLPHYQGGKEFTISAQVGIDGATEADELKVGMKMQSLLLKSMKEYFEK